MKTITSAIIALLTLTGALRAEREFFVFDNGLTDVKSAGEQASLLNKLGYDGICTRPQNANDDFFAAMDRPGNLECLKLPRMQRVMRWVNHVVCGTVGPARGGYDGNG